MTDADKLKALEKRMSGLEKALVKALDALETFARTANWKGPEIKNDYGKLAQSIGWAKQDVRSLAREYKESVKD